MAWARMDDQFYDHPKVLALLDHEEGLAAIGLWSLALGWAKRHADPHCPEEAGTIPSSLPRRLGGSSELAKLLVRVGLWAATGSGWVIHDFAHWQDLDGWARRSVKATAAINTRWDNKREADAAAAASSQEADTPSTTRSNTNVIPTTPHLQNLEETLRVSSSSSSPKNNGLDGHVRRPSLNAAKAEWVAWATAHGVEPAASASSAKVHLAELADGKITVAQLTELADASRDEPGARDDVERLCQHLASRIEEQSGKPPHIGKQWRQSARYLLDIDGYQEDKIHAAIDWCKNDEFWRPNIMSMSKLREKYLTLRAAATRQNGTREAAKVAPESWD